MSYLWGQLEEDTGVLLKYTENFPVMDVCIVLYFLVPKFFIRLHCNSFDDRLQGIHTNLKKLKCNQVIGYLL